MNILSVFITSSFLNLHPVNKVETTLTHPTELVAETDGEKRYKKRKHWLKKLIMGKRYCECPKF